MRTYLQTGLSLARGTGSRSQVEDLQRDLRRLGYLRAGIDGTFGPGTERAVKALRHDLLHNAGEGRDGAAPVRVRDYNRGRVTRVTGDLDPSLARCIVDMLDDRDFPKLPDADDPAAENRRAIDAVRAIRSPRVPTPFLIAILAQESGLRHFSVPAPGNDDRFIVVGIDANASDPWMITSRGYGIGQYTLFHHPPRPDEVADFMLDPVRNVARAIAELEDKFERFVNGPADRADDRYVEHGSVPLRRCRYGPDDPRYLRACRECLAQVDRRDLAAGTPLHAGAAGRLKATQVHPETAYRDVPMRERIPCDWPYAVRRYNGAGVNSYHYQTKVLLGARDVGAV